MNLMFKTNQIDLNLNKQIKQNKEITKEIRIFLKLVKSQNQRADVSKK